MDLRVVAGEGGLRLSGDGDDVALVNRFLEHLSVRGFAAATSRAYAYDLLNFLRFGAARALRLAEVRAIDVFDYLDLVVRAAGRIHRGGGAAAAAGGRGGGDDEPTHRRGARVVRVRGAGRCPRRQPGAGGAPLARGAGAAARAARASGAGPGARRGTAGARAMTAAGVTRCR